MRQARKLEILNFIDSLCQAHGGIKKVMGNRGRRLHYSFACREILRDSFSYKTSMRDSFESMYCVAEVNSNSIYILFNN